jgi:DNA-binding TFAR19-related protein (PDSD5 family)
MPAPSPYWTSALRDGDAILRRLVDPAYAAEVKKRLDEVRLTREELAELARTTVTPVVWW